MAQAVEPARWDKLWTIVCPHKPKCFQTCSKKMRLAGISEDLEIVARSLPNWFSLNTMFDAEEKSHWNGTQQFIEHILRRRGDKTIVVILSNEIHSMCATVTNKIATIHDGGRGFQKFISNRTYNTNQPNSNLDEKNKGKIEKMLKRQLCVDSVVFGNDGEGLGALVQYENSCASTTLVAAFWLSIGWPTVPKHTERVLRKIACKLLQIGDNDREITIRYNTTMTVNSALTELFTNY